MSFIDYDLEHFLSNGAEPLPKANDQGYIFNNGAKIWYSTFGSGFPVMLLHGGLGHSGNWGYQVPFLTNLGFFVIVVDSRGHGHSTRDSQHYSYELMTSDVIKIIDQLKLKEICVIGWSDGAIVAMILAMQIPEKIKGVFFFGCNMDLSGAKEIKNMPITLDRCFKRHKMDYNLISPTPDKFDEFVNAVNEMMSTQPNYSSKVLKTIQTPVFIVLSEFDEFIKREHAEYLAKTIPSASLIIIPGLSHFAPLQNPDLFNKHLSEFLQKVLSFEIN